MSTNSQLHIFRDQFDALVASHKAFHEVAIKVTDILQDPSRSACYQSLPNYAEDGIGVEFTEYGQNASNGDDSAHRGESDGVRSHSKRHVADQRERKSAQQEESIFVIENMRARKAYKQKRQRSMELYARASVSYLDAEYDFQCMPAPLRFLSTHAC